MIIRRKRLLGIGLCVMAAALAFSLIYVRAIQVAGNFATVVEGEAYRSNQPTAAKLAEYQQALGIKSVLNLRGAAPGADWYEEERAAAEELGLHLIDFSMSSQTELPMDRAEVLLSLMMNAPKPILIHCRSGANRTGLASVMYLALVSGVDEHEAEAQLSLRFGHFSVPVLSEGWAMDQTWEKLEKIHRLE
jgi:protein tyrosine/serine phosphatase